MEFGTALGSFFLMPLDEEKAKSRRRYSAVNIEHDENIDPETIPVEELERVHTHTDTVHRIIIFQT